MPPVRRFWVMVANLPPPVPRKMSSSGEVGVVMLARRLSKVVVMVANLFSFFGLLAGCKFYFLIVCFI